MASGWEARVEQAVDAWNRGDVQDAVTTLLEGVDPEIEVHPDPNWPEKGPFKGFEGSRDLVNSWLVAWGTAGRVEIDEFRDLGQGFIVRARFNLAGAGSGAEVEMATSCLAELEDGIAVRAHFFFDHGEALKLAEVAD